MTACSRVTGGTEIIVHAVAAEVEFAELRTICVPLKYDRLGPVVPKRCGDDEILIDESGAAVFVIIDRVALNRGESIIGRTVDTPILGGEMHVCYVVVRFVNRQPTRIRVMAMEYAARRREKRLRQLRTVRAIANERREDTGLESAGKSRIVGDINQSLR